MNLLNLPPELLILIVEQLKVDSFSQKDLVDLSLANKELGTMAQHILHQDPWAIASKHNSILLARTLLSRPDLAHEVETMMFKLPITKKAKHPDLKMSPEELQQFLMDCAIQAMSTQHLWGERDRRELMRWVKALQRGETLAIRALLLTLASNLRFFAPLFLDGGDVAKVIPEHTTLFGVLGYDFPADIVTVMIKLDKLKELMVVGCQLPLLRDLCLPSLRSLIVWVNYHKAGVSAQPTKRIFVPRLEKLDVKVHISELRKKRQASVHALLQNIETDHDGTLKIKEVIFIIECLSPRPVPARPLSGPGFQYFVRDMQSVKDTLEVLRTSLMSVSAYRRRCKGVLYRYRPFISLSCFQRLRELEVFQEAVIPHDYCKPNFAKPNLALLFPETLEKLIINCLNGAVVPWLDELSDTFSSGFLPCLKFVELRCDPASKYSAWWFGNLLHRHRASTQFLAGGVTMKAVDMAKTDTQRMAAENDDLDWVLEF
ncbi:hypothetical protein CC80DRAFT_534000 [Byssothecium circinans]|uniref:F-box domain-containing protein n=1 Tax=Byssothecium circinans TaxID=147558 RepID=A0A6A5UAP0_9PLEO|nr:hypothetical protein CC80DRAFT_534000 [Byssothecium circinans]